jgi:hypothetical protein
LFANAINFHICDCQLCYKYRHILTKKQAHEQLSKLAGVVVKLRGIYKAPGAVDLKPQERKLHLHVTSDCESNIKKALSILAHASATGVLVDPVQSTSSAPTYSPYVTIPPPGSQQLPQPYGTMPYQVSMSAGPAQPPAQPPAYPQSMTWAPTGAPMQYSYPLPPTGAQPLTLPSPPSGQPPFPPGMLPPGYFQQPHIPIPPALPSPVGFPMPIVQPLMVAPGLSAQPLALAPATMNIFETKVSLGALGRRGVGHPGFTIRHKIMGPSGQNLKNIMSATTARSVCNLAFFSNRHHSY